MESESTADQDRSTAGEPGASRSPRPAGRSRGRGDEGRRRRADRRAYAGFGDGIERAYCTRYVTSFPPDFPVSQRASSATLRLGIVARRDEAVLLCDRGHHGEHVWPDGDTVALNVRLTGESLDTPGNPERPAESPPD